MKEPRLRFNKKELSIIREKLSECYLEHELMSAEIGLSRAKKENASENELNQWKVHITDIKQKRKVNKNLIRKINKYFGFDNEE